MIETIIKDFLDKNLGNPSYFEHEDEMPERYVMIDRTGGNQKTGLKTAIVAFQSYAETLYQAVTLNERVKEVVARMIELDTIASVRLNSDYNFTDIQIKKYRYQAVFEFIYY